MLNKKYFLLLKNDEKVVGTQTETARQGAIQLVSLCVYT